MRRNELIIKNAYNKINILTGSDEHSMSMINHKMQLVTFMHLPTCTVVIGHLDSPYTLQEQLQKGTIKIVSPIHTLAHNNGKAKYEPMGFPVHNKESKNSIHCVTFLAKDIAMATEDIHYLNRNEWIRHYLNYIESTVDAKYVEEIQVEFDKLGFTETKLVKMGIMDFDEQMAESLGSAIDSE
jgi:hypothetical protein